MSVYSRVSNADAESLEAINGISLSRIAAINASVSSAFALLLNESYGEGAVAAYSVRKINALHPEGSMVVRRDSDDDSLVIGFDSNNNLDVSAIETFCGTANGYVSLWLDQSGNKNNASQSAETSQPKIYDATTGVVMKHGRPALTRATIFTRLDLRSTIVLDGEFSHFTLCTTYPSDNPWGGDSSGTEQTTWAYFPDTETNWRLINSRGIVNYNVPKTPSGTRLLQNHNRNSSNSTPLYLDGYLSSSPSTGNSYYVKGVMGSPWFDYKGFGQEMIFYKKDQTGNRTDIESNIGEYYGNNVDLLDTYSGAAGAYSLRKLFSSYQGPLVRVREDGNDSTLDIYPNIFNELDTVALAAHCGDKNGFIVSWYDQSTSGNHTTQPSFLAQPKIYDAITGVETENEKPTVVFDGTNDFLDYTGLAASTLTTFHVAKPDQTNIKSTVSSYVGNDGDMFFRYDNAGNMLVACSGSLTSTQTYTAAQNQVFVRLGTTLAIGYNGEPAITGSATGRTSTGIRIGQKGGLDYMRGNIQELIVYPFDQTANRKGIEDNANSFYGIYDTGLIGEYGGAAAAYSLRSLSSVYDGAAITVRRDSDDSTKNIYFDSNGNLDTADLIGFCGKNNGHVIRWFDQSGNANHGIQTAEAAQPKVYDSVTGIYYENGTPSLRFERVSDSVGDTLFTPAQQWIGAGDSASSVIVTNKYQTPYGSSSLFSSNGGGTNRSFQWAAASSPAKIVFNVIGSTSASSPNFNFNGLNIRAAYMSSATIEGYESGVDLGSGTAGSGLYNPSIEIYMGARHGANEGHYFGMFKEFILWNSYLGADKVDIDRKINEHYLIYQPDTAPTSGLLATYSGSGAAFSLRQLSNEAVIAVTVRRDSDDAVSPIGFKGGVIDTSAMAAWCGNSNGYVTTWWDQSTLGNHATSPSLTSQPLIYDGNTGVVTEHGKPAIEFKASEATRLSYTDSYSGTKADFSIYSVARHDGIVTDTKRTYWAEGTAMVWGPSTRSFPNTTVNINMTQAVNGAQELRGASFTLSPANYVGSINGAIDVSGTGTWTSITRSNSGNIGSRSNGNWSLNGNIQEIILYQSDQSANRTGIETNILEFYTQYILDEYSGAAAAYSLRALSSTATNAVQVRRDSDDSTQYIGFVRDGFSLSLDTSALSTFCGSANGYVSEWVDQSGNLNHATQPALTSQPKIYDGTTGVITRNGKPAIYTDRDSNTSGDKLITPATTWMDVNLEYACITVFQPGSGNVGDTWVWDSSGGGTNKAPSIKSVSGVGIQMQAIGTTSAIVAVSSAGQAIRSAYLSSGTLEAFYNGSSAGTATAAGTYNASIERYMGSRIGANEGHYDGYFQELIWYASDQSSNRTNIEDNINGYYDIY